MKHLGVRAFHGAPFQRVAVPDPVSTLMPQLSRRHYAFFWGALASGLGGLVGLTEAVIHLHSVALEDVFIVLGSLLVPSLYVYYLDVRNLFVDPRWRVTVATFVLGALLGVPIAAILETFLPAGTGAPVPALVTGLIEEFAKATAILWLLRRGARYLQFEMDGIILGAAAGMGFAALEDMLYGAGAFHHGMNDVLVTVWARQILGPFGHGTWTAIVGGAIWRAKGAGPPRITLAVVGAYLLAACLHAAWDWEPLSGLAGLFWLLAVGVIGLLVLRSMIHTALTEEKRLIAASHQGSPQPMPEPPIDSSSST